MVYVLIPAHNNKNEVLGLLECLSRQTCRDIKIVLVDDGSTDGTEKEVASRFPQVTTLKGDGNLWWTGANVLGVTYLLDVARDGDFVLLINNDLVVDDDYVRQLVSCSERLGRALVGSTTVDSKDHRRMLGGIRLDSKLRSTLNSDVAVIGEIEWDAQVDVLPGRGTLIPLEVFHRVGNFNERRLPHYGADYEFTARAKRAGFLLAVSHRAKVYANLGITGIHPPDRLTLSMVECGRLLFSRKSSANLYYHLTYVWMCSEPGWRLRNTVSHGLGLLMDTFGKTLVGAPFAAGLRLCLKGLRIMRTS